MKRKIFIIALVTTFILSGCGEKEKVITGKNDNNNSVSQTNNNDQNTPKPSEQGYVFKTGDVEIEIEAEAKEYIDALGEPQSYYEAPSCAFGDLDKVYTYNGFELNTFQENGTDYVSSVILKDDSVSTKEGVCIGDDAAKVTETYGDYTSKTDKAFVYAKGNMKLCFFIEDDVIVSIEYLNTLMDR